MSSMPDLTGLVDTASPTEATAAASPFTSINYHFGMLLGVDDFETEQDYGRGKMRLHNAWLHRDGVVWGFGVGADLASDEIRVEPGLALDADGRELHLDARACVNVGAWYAAHKDDAELDDSTDAAGNVTFDAHVQARFRACLTRPVPAFADPCEGASSETAYSRVLETVELLLVPGLAERPPDPYHRLRVLFGVAAAATESDGTVTAADQEVLDARTDDPVALLEAFRRFAALDELDLAPAATGEPDDAAGKGILPAPDDAPLVLANVRGIALTPNGDTWTLTAAGVDATIRPAHVATRTIQELLCARGAGTSVSGGAGGGGADAGGPRIAHDSVTLAERTVTLTVDKALDPVSVDPEAFRVSVLGDSGWKHIKITTAHYDDGTRLVTLKLRTNATGHVVRIEALGTGINPLVGADSVPLAGEVGGPPATQHQGADFVHMLKES